MLKRLLHCIICGHAWLEKRRVFMPPSYPDRLLLCCGSDYDEKYGFTHVVSICECGARRIDKYLGDYSNMPDVELAMLRKMTGMK